MSITDPLPDAQQMQAESAAVQGEDAANAIGGGPGAGRSRWWVDLASAYFLAACRVIAWGGITGIYLYYCQPRYFALLALARGTVGLLGYLGVGIGPALVHRLSQYLHKPMAVLPLGVSPGTDQAPADRSKPDHSIQDTSAPRSDHLFHQPLALEYEISKKRLAPPLNDFERCVSGGLGIAILGILLLYAISFIYAPFFAEIHGLSRSVEWEYARSFAQGEAETLVILFTFGMIMRLLSEPLASVLQVRRKIALDNNLQAISELIWLGLVFLLANPDQESVEWAGKGFVFANLFLLLGRYIAVITTGKTRLRVSFSRKLIGPLLTFGSAVLLAQLADFLHGPTDQLLIGWFLNQESIAIYNPALQIDAGLLLLVGGLATILLPRSAMAHARGDVATLRRYYLRGTAASILLLIVGALAALWIAPHVLGRWLHDSRVAMGTLAILPWVLVHTVLGGSSAIGRSILLGMGRVKVFAWVALASGILNVLISAILVKYTSLGLKGIVLGTIITVALRCVVWMPWYVMKCLPRETGQIKDSRPH